MTTCTPEDCRRPLQAARRSKYGNRKTAYSGRLYDSAKEAAYVAELGLRKRAGDIREWQPQFPLKLRVNGRLVCTLTIDFQIILADGREELHEVKDHATREWILKEKIFQALYPDRTLIVVR